MLSDSLYRAALDTLAKSLDSDDEKVALRAAQIVLDLLARAPHIEVPKEVQIVFLEPDSLIDQFDNQAESAASGAGDRVGRRRALQSGGLRTALGQDGSW